MGRQDAAMATWTVPHCGFQACTHPPVRTWKAWVTNRPTGENRVAWVSGKGHSSSGKGTDGREAIVMSGGTQMNK